MKQNETYLCGMRKKDKHKRNRYTAHNISICGAGKVSFTNFLFSVPCLTVLQGQSHKSPVLSSGLCGSGKKTNTSAVFLKEIASLHKKIGMIFEAVNRSAYHNYLGVFHRQLDITALNMLHTSRQMCFMCVIVNRNNKVIPHKDVSNFRNGWAVMCCFGDFENGEPCLLTLKSKIEEGEKERIRIQYGPGDVVLFRATLFEHWSDGYKGHRTCLVYHIKNNC